MHRLTDRANFKSPWTDELLNQLAEMLAAGRTIPEIAKEMGRSQEAVRGKAWKHGLLTERKRRGSTDKVESRAKP
jgi:predicted transcriptional regulator